MSDEIDLEQGIETSADTVSLPGLDKLLRYLHESRAFDFTGYKRTGLERRLQKRVAVLGLQSFDDYVDYLEVHPTEFDNLFNAILINATSFFRDPVAWEFLAQHVVPQIVENRKKGTIRIWSAGCATGQEAYTVAMVLAQALGLDALHRRVKIYATDIDDDALTQARQATYTPKEVSSVPDSLVDTYFERTGPKYTFRKEARRSVIFGRHNLLSDAPISRVDLLLCRNTLMYFNADAQSRILSSMHFALAESGVLFLGKAEMLLTHSPLFSPLDLKRRLFTKLLNGYARGRMVPTPIVNRPELPRDPADDETRMRQAAFEAAPVAQVALTPIGTVTVLNAEAHKLLEMGAGDIGQSIYDTAIGRRLPSLRALIDRAIVDRRTSTVSGCEVRSAQDSLFLDIIATPLVDDHEVQGVHMSFVDVTATRRLQQELEQASQDLEGAYGELQATSEELETTNEELQSTVEELETTNEELQSTNEELETTNEELQSTNEELQTMNDTLRVRTTDLGRVNLYFESILASLEAAVIVLDLELHVQVWSQRATDLWGMRADEAIGQHFFALDIGLPVERLRTEIRACASGEHEYVEASVTANNRKGKLITCAVKVSRLTQDGQSKGTILLMDEQPAMTS